jgi:hypothetical protein
MVSFTAKKLIMVDVLPRGSTFNQLYFVNSIFPDLKTANLNFRRSETRSTCSGYIDNSICHHGSKVRSKIKKNHNDRMYPTYSPDISPCDFWLFGMLKQTLRDREFSSSAETEDAIARVWNGLTFDDAQGMFRGWIRCVACVGESDGEYINESKKICFLMSTAC